MEGQVKILDKDGTDQGDSALFWELSLHMTPRHGADLLLSGQKIQISVTRARKKVHVYVNGQQWVPATKADS